MLCQPGVVVEKMRNAGATVGVVQWLQWAQSLLQQLEDPPGPSCSVASEGVQRLDGAEAIMNRHSATVENSHRKVLSPLQAVSGRCVGDTLGSKEVRSHFRLLVRTSRVDPLRRPGFLALSLL